MAVRSGFMRLPRVAARATEWWRSFRRRKLSSSVTPLSLSSMVSDSRASKVCWKKRSAASGSRVVIAKWPRPMAPVTKPLACICSGRSASSGRVNSSKRSRFGPAKAQKRSTPRSAASAPLTSRTSMRARAQPLQDQLQRMLVVQLPADGDHVLGRAFAHDHAALVRVDAQRQHAAVDALGMQAQAVAGKALPFGQLARFDHQVAQADAPEQAGRPGRCRWGASCAVSRLRRRPPGRRRRRR